MSQNNITPEAALANLSLALEPFNLVKLSRGDLIAAQGWLVTIDSALKELAALKAPKDSP